MTHDLTHDEITALATLRESIEWETVEAVITRQIRRIESQLGEANFDHLAQVTRLQGERRSLIWFLKLVEKAHQKEIGE